MKSADNNCCGDSTGLLAGGRQTPISGYRRPLYPSPGCVKHDFALISHCGIILSTMNKAQQKTLSALFSTPTPISLEWRKIESLLLALGSKSIEGSGSRVRFELNGVVASFHRPHPSKEAKPYQVRDAKEFLLQAGVKP